MKTNTKKEKVNFNGCFFAGAILLAIATFYAVLLIVVDYLLNKSA